MSLNTQHTYVQLFTTDYLPATKYRRVANYVFVFNNLIYKYNVDLGTKSLIKHK